MDTKFILLTAAVCLSLAGAQQNQQSPQFQQYQQNQQDYGWNSNYYDRWPATVHNFQRYADGSYSFNYDTVHRTFRDETGTFRDIGEKYPALTVRGSYGYYPPLGEYVQVNYIADEYGFQPWGNSINPNIQRAVQYQVAKARAAKSAVKRVQ